MSTSSPAHEMPTEPEHTIDPEDFGPFATEYVIRQMIDFYFPKTTYTAGEELPPQKPEENEVLAAMRPFQQTLARQLNAKRDTIEYVGLDEQGPAGILGEVVANVHMPAVVFPPNLRPLFITRTPDGITHVTKPVVDEQGQTIYETLWTFASAPSPQPAEASVAETTDAQMQEPFRVEFGPNIGQHALDAIRQWIAFFRRKDS